MNRGIGELDLLQPLIPEWAAVIVALLTQLGDIWFLGLLLGLLYWFDRRNQDDIAIVAGVWLAGMGLYKGLKEVFAFPRPDEPLLDPDVLPIVIRQLYEATAMASGYGFPSGHAVGTTIVYFGLAYVLDIWTRRTRLLLAAGIVTTVSFTRLALGVHFLVDVVVGVLVGMVLLGLAWALFDRVETDRPTVGFALGIAFGGFFVATSGVDEDAVFITGAALGAFGGWQLIELGRSVSTATVPSQTVRPLLVRAALAVAAIAPLVASIEVFPLLTVYSTGGAVGLTAAGIVVLPIARHSRRVRNAGKAAWFWLQAAGTGIRSLLDPDQWRRAAETIKQFVRQREK